MRFIVLTAAILAFSAPRICSAQMVLPGAISAPTPAGQAGAPPMSSSPAHRGGRPTVNGSSGDLDSKAQFTAAKPPSVETVLGKTFSLHGSHGALEIEKSGANLRVARLVLTGDKISHPNLACEISMSGAEPLELRPLGASDGVERFELQSSACPLTMDVLSGALRVSSPKGACLFEQADCRVDPTGLWGPAGDGFSEIQVKSIERERSSLEKSTRAHFRILLNKYKKDKAAAQAAVIEQAAFSANRAQTCRDYDREETHGFCALRLTEARDYLLQSRISQASLAKSGDKPNHESPRAAAKRAHSLPKQ